MNKWRLIHNMKKYLRLKTGGDLRQLARFNSGMRMVFDGSALINAWNCKVGVAGD